ncbi:hypothetical protein Hanom_Chr15g01378631 [Helianthus anomalus]
MYHFQMKDLQPSKWINVGVINCFTSMLNHEENGIVASHLSRATKKATLTWIRKKYAVKLVTSSAYKHRDHILAEAKEYGKACNLG